MRHNFPTKLIYLAISSALIILGNDAYANCTGSVASSSSPQIICNNNNDDGANANIRVSNTTTYVDTTNAGSNSTYATGGTTLLQFDGHGRTLTVDEGALIANYRNIAGARTTVYMGAPTTNASASTIFGAGAIPSGIALKGADGTTTITTLNNTSVTNPSASVTTVIYGGDKTGTLVQLAAAPSASLVGQSLIFGRWSPADGGDYIPGTAYKIVAFDATNKLLLVDGVINSASFGSADASLSAAYAVVSNYGQGVDKTYSSDSLLGQLFSQGERFNEATSQGGTTTIKFNNVIENNGTIASRIQESELLASPTATGAYVGTIKAITTSVFGDYLIDNSATGLIKAQHAGLGAAYAIEAGGTVTSMSINNNGQILAVRDAVINPADFTAISASASPSSKSGAYSSATVGNVNAINTQEELATLHLYNGVNGVIKSSGDYTGTILSRAGEKYIINDGLIEHVSSAGGANYGKGYAIGSASNGSSSAVDTRKLDLLNNGQIHGDVMAVNGNPLRWNLLSTIGTTAVAGNNNLALGLDDRLDINSYYGQSDSNIINSAGATIIGNLFFANGTHVLSNEGTITGNIDLDQRNSYGVSVSGSQKGTLVGTKDFTFNNNGDFTGNIQIFTANSNSGDVNSSAKLSPLVFGHGSNSDANPNTSNIKYFNGDLNVMSTETTGGDYKNNAGGSVAGNVYIAPRLADGVVVRDGEVFKVANGVFTGSSYVGLTQSLAGSLLKPAGISNGLVTWDTSINANKDLIVKATVDTGGVDGLSSRASPALNALMGFDSLLGSHLQNMASSDEIRKAAEQIRPQVNGASYQASLNMVDKLFGLVGSRLDEVHLAALAGRNGVVSNANTGETGFWFQGLGVKTEQDRRKSVDGYNADAYGFAFGADKLINDDTRAGLLLAYGRSDIDAKGGNWGDKVNIDSYQASVYGSSLLKTAYINYTAGVAYHDYSSRRNILDGQVKGSHDGYHYSVKVDGGYPIALGVSTIVPLASMTYAYLNEDAYKESGEGALRYSSRATDSFRTGLGAKWLIPLAQNTFNAGLEMRAIWQHEFADNSIDTTAQFVDGGYRFRTNGVSLGRDSANLGASLRISGNSGGLKQSINLNYDADMRSQYLNQTVSIQARFDF